MNNYIIIYYTIKYYIFAKFYLLKKLLVYYLKRFTNFYYILNFSII